MEPSQIPITKEEEEEEEEERKKNKKKTGNGKNVQKYICISTGSRDTIQHNFCQIVRNKELSSVRWPRTFIRFYTTTLQRLVCH